MALLCPSGVTLHFSRMGGYDLDQIPDENQMAGMGDSDLSGPLKLLAGAKPDVILYGCTSATLTHGPAFDRNLSQRIKRDYAIPAVTAAGALVLALKSMGIKQIAFASPYVENINKTAIAFLQDSGFDVVSTAGIDDELDNYGQGSLTPEKICEMARQADHQAAHAIVLSCTDMRAVETVAQLESELNKPVITSNQAMLFASLPYINVSPAEIDCGALFRQE